MAYGVEGGGLDALNVMNLTSPQSAILSAIIFNALIIIVLIPLALRGVASRAMSAAALLRRNLLMYGLGGLLAPFIGIMLIDLILTALASDRRAHGGGRHEPWGGDLPPCRVRTPVCHCGAVPGSPRRGALADHDRDRRDGESHDRDGEGRTAGQRQQNRPGKVL